jgi:hypothetical protein
MLHMRILHVTGNVQPEDLSKLRFLTNNMWAIWGISMLIHHV